MTSHMDTARKDGHPDGLSPSMGKLADALVKLEEAAALFDDLPNPLGHDRASYGERLLKARDVIREKIYSQEAQNIGDLALILTTWCKEFDGFVVEEEHFTPVIQAVLRYAGSKPLADAAE